MKNVSLQAATGTILIERVLRRILSAFRSSFPLYNKRSGKLFRKVYRGGGGGNVKIITFIKTDSIRVLLENRSMVWERELKKKKKIRFRSRVPLRGAGRVARFER